VPTVMPVYGTRPEAIKMAPIIERLGSSSLDVVVAVTGQHREMLDQVNRLFGIEPEHDLDIIRPGQSLSALTARTLERMTPVLDAVRPDAVVVQGDTTSAFAASLAAFYHGVPVFHVEAGLRTANPVNPFPEEMNRRLTGRIAALHLAPTATSRDNLLREGVSPETVVVTGNSVIDALLTTVARGEELAHPALGRVGVDGRRTVLVTAHRRESWGEPLERVAAAIATLARRHPDVDLVLPLHANPLVRETILPAVDGLSNVVVTDPLPYGDFSRLIALSDVVLTDSGGVQEEAPSLGKPVLVMRENTERPEAVDAGTVRLVGTSHDVIVDAVSGLLDDPSAYAAMANAVNPYGDGRAADRTVAAFEHHFGLAERIDEFDPAA
jgi:UDP-N-acetylglucosamine 2-epimerase (non-hydrolysing)